MENTDIDRALLVNPLRALTNKTMTSAIDFQSMFRKMRAEHLQKKANENNRSSSSSQTENQISIASPANTAAEESDAYACKNEQKSKPIDGDDNCVHQKFMEHSFEFNNEQLMRFDAKQHYLPSSKNCYYISNFLSQAFEDYVLQWIESAPDSNWIQLKRRRLQCYGGKQSTKNPTLFETETLPIWCSQFCDKLYTDSFLLPYKYHANHILINEYKPGQGITAHRDGPKYYSRVVIISLHDILCINFYVKPPSISDTECAEHEPTFQVILEPRSCLVFEDELYTDLFHTIHEKTYDIVSKNVINLHMIDKQKYPFAIGDKIYRTQKRVSMTIRHVFHDESDSIHVKGNHKNSLLSVIDLTITWIDRYIQK